MFKSKEKQPEWDQNFEPLMQLILGKKGIKTKSASEVGRKKVDYFRGKDFKKYLLENPNTLKKKCQPALNTALGSPGSAAEPPETDKDIERIGDELIAKNFCFKAMYKPLNPTKTEAGSEKPTKKWPDRLARTSNQKFDCEGFYVITYEGGSGMRHLMLALIIAGVLLACMWPVWPMWAKVGIWYFSVLFLTFYFGVLIIRMIVYTMFWIVGFDFWIFPNINDEYCSFMDSFKPFYSWDRRKDDAFMLLVRFGSLAITAAAIQQIAETHSLSDVTEFMEHSMTDLLDWGVEKIKYLPDSEKQALPSLELLKEQHAQEEANESLASMSAEELSKWTDGAEKDAEVEADGEEDDVIEAK